MEQTTNFYESSSSSSVSSSSVSSSSVSSSSSCSSSSPTTFGSAGFAKNAAKRTNNGVTEEQGVGEPVRKRRRATGNGGTAQDFSRHDHRDSTGTSTGDSTASSGGVGEKKRPCGHQRSCPTNGMIHTPSEVAKNLLRTNQRLRKPWQEFFDDLVQYKEEHGDCKVPYNYSRDPSLAHWVMNQKTQKRYLEQGRPSFMTPARVKQLDEIGFTWARARQQHDSWDTRFEELEEYQREFGDCNVPVKYKLNPFLGEWVQLIRKNYKRHQNGGKSRRMTQDRIDRLNSIGFSWYAPRRLTKKWDERLAELIKYKEEHGDCNVPYRYAPNHRLGLWVSRQRSQKRLADAGQESEMTLHRYKVLDDLGFRWYSKWECRVKELEEYRQEFGDCNVPLNYPPNPALGKWVANHIYRRTLLSQDCVDQLDAIGFCWASKQREDGAGSAERNDSGVSTPSLPDDSVTDTKMQSPPDPLWKKHCSVVWSSGRCEDLTALALFMERRRKGPQTVQFEGCSS